MVDKYTLEPDGGYNKRWSHLVIKIQESNSYETTEIWNSDSMNAIRFNGWAQSHAIVGRIKSRFRIAYTARDYSPHHSTAYVALANIQMVGCRTDTKGYCGTNSFHCSNSHCVDPEYVCDGADDCGDGSDEGLNACSAFKSRCDFEYGMCQWGRYGLYNWTVATGSAHVSLQDGPTRDHTKGIGSGHYLALFSDQYKFKTALITGPQLVDNNDDEDDDDDDYYYDDDYDNKYTVPCKMRFWLSVEGNYTQAGSLSINIEDTQSGTLRPIWTAPTGYFPLNVFGYSRIITTALSNNWRPYRVVIKGNFDKHHYDYPLYQVYPCSCLLSIE